MKPKMVGTVAKPIQIDEARFAGRILNGDALPLSEDDDVEVENDRNHGTHVDGPWVLGARQGNDCCYFVVERGAKNTLVPLIKRECELGSVIHSDELPAYRSLTAKEYEHLCVDHQQNYVDLDYGAHTQGIERSWLDAKIKVMKKHRGVPLYLLQSHLDHYC